jgi:hypothetical protein
MAGANHGGKRAGAGRPRGALGKKTRERQELVRAKAEVMTAPLDWLLMRLADESLPATYRDKLAALAAPYCSPRLSAVSVTKRPAAMSDSEIAQLLGLVQEDITRAGEDRDHYPYAVIEHSPSDDKVKH